MANWSKALCVFALLWVAAVLGLILVPSASDGSTVIRDKRLTDLSLTPVLGRGYSLATNTYQSACLSDVKITEPSYDFVYRFDEVSETKSKQMLLLGPAGGPRSAVGTGEEQEMLDEANALDGSSYKTSNKKTKRLFVTLNVDTYYASVNESASPLAESAQELLSRGDFPGFFAACGPYYIRGITRNAKFTGLVSWKEIRGTTQATATLIKQQLTGSDSALTVSPDGGVETETAAMFKNSELSILVRGWGIGKSGSGSLIATNIDEFKSAVKDAFMSMQNPLTGRATTMELVPWVENLSFQAFAKITGKDIVNNVALPMYRKKDILTNNAEFMNEAQRAARVRLQNYYFAKTCKQELRNKFYSRGFLQMPDFLLKNHRGLKAGVTLAQLDAELSSRKINALFDKEYLPFLRRVDICLSRMMKSPGGGGGLKQRASSGVPSSGSGEGDEAQPNEEASAQAGAGRAVPNRISKDTGRGLWLMRWTNHKECLELHSELVPEATPGWTIIEEHCLPTLMR